MTTSTALVIRTESAVESFLEDAIESLTTKGDETPEQTALAQLNLLLKEYLGIGINGTSVQDISETIRSSEQYLAWSAKVEDIDLETQFDQINGDAESWEEAIYEANLVEILEQLSSNSDR